MEPDTKTDENVVIWEKKYQVNKNLLDDEVKDAKGIVWSFATKEGAAQLIHEPEERKKLLWLAEGNTSRRCLQAAFENTLDYYSNESGSVQFPGAMVETKINILSLFFILSKKKQKILDILNKESAPSTVDNDIDEIQAEVNGLKPQMRELVCRFLELSTIDNKGNPTPETAPEPPAAAGNSPLFLTTDGSGAVSGLNIRKATRQTA